MIAKHKETEMMHSWTSNGVIAQKILNKLRSVLIILELHPWLAGSVLVVIFVALFLDRASFPSDRRFLVDLFRRYILAAPISSQFSKSPAAFSDYLFFG